MFLLAPSDQSAALALLTAWEYHGASVTRHASLHPIGQCRGSHGACESSDGVLLQVTESELLVFRCTSIRKPLALLCRETLEPLCCHAAICLAPPAAIDCDTI